VLVSSCSNSSLEIYTYIVTTNRDAVTPNQDFIISPHPHSKNLYIAGGGSFYGWKFLANIGSYVVEMLEGKLDAEKAQKWA